MLYAHVALNVPVNQLFTYHVPEALLGALRVGHLVKVGFGTTTQPAVVMALDETSAVPHTKPILDLLDTQPVLDDVQVQLAHWLSEATLASVGAAVWLWLPPAFTGRSVRVVNLVDPLPDAALPDGLMADIVAYLRAQQDVREATLEKHFGAGVRQALNALKHKGFICFSSVLTAPTVRPKTVRTVRLIVPRRDVPALKLRAKARVIVEYLAQFDSPQDAADLASAVGATSTDLLNLERKGIVLLGERVVYRDRLADQDFIAHDPPTLTPEQAEVWARIQRLMRAAEGRVGLLHGVTGSGKTELYLRAIAETIQRGQQAIFLVPEIALTPQTIQRVAARFPNRVGVVHSSLSTGERYDTWQRARRGDLDVIVGTRSALFAPLRKLGLVILDEEHDSSYKQSPPVQPPYYHARDVAERLMRLRGGTLLLGSATPSLEVYHRAQEGQIAYLRLPNRIMGHRLRVESQAQRGGVTTRYIAQDGDRMMIDLPPVQVVDMREELKAGNTSMFSRALQTALTDVLERGEQAILFLNRRGQSTYVFCRDCGYIEKCPRCATPMTYHGHDEALRCHHCGFMQPALKVCPQCASQRIRYFGAGTQQVESELKRLFPDVSALRWDADTAQNIDAHEAILASFVQRQAQVMIGTQMIAKGLDLPFVTLVGVVSADLGLALPDFRASERTFQLLTQVAGRAGRGVLGGQVILQTYQPEHASIRAASQHDYEAFYREEIKHRRELGYPPFRRMLRLLVQHPNPQHAQRSVEQLAERLHNMIRFEDWPDASVIGPAPAFFTKIDNHYRWHVLLRAADPAALVRQLGPLPEVYVDVDVIDVL
ncbi:MAG: primosomal protein N' [Anaerolinea sp.]